MTLRSWFKLKERSARDWKVRSTKVDAGDFKHELLNRLRWTMAVNVLIAVEDLYLLYSNTQSDGSEGRKVFCKIDWDLCL